MFTVITTYGAYFRIMDDHQIQLIFRFKLELEIRHIDSLFRTCMYRIILMHLIRISSEILF